MYNTLDSLLEYLIKADICSLNIKTLENLKSNISIFLNNLKTAKASPEDIDDLLSWKTRVEKEINKKQGINEINARKELKQQQSRIDERNKQMFYALKKKYDKVNKLNNATTNFINMIDELSKEDVDALVKVKV